MTDVFKGYLSNYDRAVEILESTLRKNMTECNVILESTLAKHQLNMVNAEYKVLCESGTFNDLETLYEASGEEVSKKSKNLLMRMIETIGNFFRNITNKIASLFTRENIKDASNSKETIEVAEDPNKITAMYNNAVLKAKGLIGKIKSGHKVTDEEIDSIKSPFETAAKTGGVIVTIAAATAGIVGVVKNKDKILKSIDDIKRDIDARNNLSDEQVGNIKKVLNALSVVTGAVGKKVSSVSKDIRSKFKITKKKSGEVTESSEDDDLDILDDVIDTADDVLDGSAAEDLLPSEDTPAPSTDEDNDDDGEDAGDVPTEDEVEELMELVSFI